MFDFSLRPERPLLAWIAECVAASDVVRLSHGQLVETNEEFFCEAVWDGEFVSGNFDQTDIVAGSGGRIRGHEVTFVSAGSTCDRLVFSRDHDRVWISNSLICLLHTINASVAVAYKYYHDDFFSAAHGLNKYKKTIATSKGDVCLVYFNNLVWNGTDLYVREKTSSERDFSSYSSYVGFLQDSMDRMSVNMKDTAREFPFSLLTSLSSGYDSTTVAALAQKAGCKEALSFSLPNIDIPDDGAVVAEVLGLRQHIRNRDAWLERQDLSEPIFIAADAKGEDRYYAGAENLLHRRVLTSGYHGDKVWAKHAKDRSDQIVRGDTSGLSLTEFRLKVGFIHCPVPFWGVRQIGDVVRLSNSEEMKAWDVPGWYSRPICRRIVEEAGVPREVFGRRKTMASIQNHGKNFLSSNSTRDYLTWLRAHRWRLIKDANFPIVISSRLDNGLCTMLGMIESLAVKVIHFLDCRAFLWRLRSNRALRFLSNLQLNVGPLYLRRYKFPWAVAKTQEYFASNAEIKSETGEAG